MTTPEQTQAREAAGRATDLLLRARRALDEQLADLSAACARHARAAQAEPRDHEAEDAANADADDAYQAAQEVLEEVFRLTGQAAWAEEERRRAFER